MRTSESHVKCSVGHLGYLLSTVYEYYELRLTTFFTYCFSPNNSREVRSQGLMKRQLCMLLRDAMAILLGLHLENIFSGDKNRQKQLVGLYVVKILQN